MALIERENLKTLSGPYGTVITEEGHRRGIEDLADPLKVVNGGIYRDVNLAVASGYAQCVDVLAANTFAARFALHTGQRELYREAVTEHYRLVAEAIESVRRPLNLVVAIGTYGDCYRPEEAPDIEMARTFHGQQFSVIGKLANVDSVLAETLCTTKEAIGIALAARDNHVPVIISFVVDATGKLLSGTSVEEAVKAVDAASDGYPVGYSLNCCPIDGAIQALDKANGRGGRFVLVYPNASDVDPRLLDGVTEGTGVAQTVADPHARAEELVRLTKRYPNVAIIGGCCGFDHQSIGAIAERVRRVSGG